MKKFFVSASLPVVLTILLFVLGCFYLLCDLFGYMFFPFNIYITNLILAAVIIFLTVRTFRNKKEKTKATTICCMALPPISIFFLYFKMEATNYREAHMLPFFVLGCITLICSMALFLTSGQGGSISLIFANGQRNGIKIGLGIVYVIVQIPFMLLLILLLLASNFVAVTVVTSEMSPNSVYLAEVISNDEGALGGSTHVKIWQQNCNINLLIGKLKKDPKRIYTGRWGDAFGMSLRWETDDILYIDNVRYEIKPDTP